MAPLGFVAGWTVGQAGIDDTTVVGLLRKASVLAVTLQSCTSRLATDDPSSPDFNTTPET